MPDSPLPPHLDTQFQQGLTWLREHLLNHAEQTFRQVLTAEPRHTASRRLWGIALHKLGRRAEGIAAIAEAVRGADDNLRGLADLAVALRDDGQFDAAANAYARALAAQPPGAHAPPLAAQVFSTDRAAHDFRIVDYPYRAEIRYGAGRPSHPELAGLIGGGDSRYSAFLRNLGDLRADFAAIPLGGRYEDAGPFWLNAWFPPLDGMALTGMLTQHNPARFIEIGSGVSTKFARRAIAGHGLRTHLTSIDPEPRNEVDRLCDTVIRQPLERCPPETFAALEAGDILFLDSSHRAFQGSDVTVFFLEILPRLRPGVIVHIHDIYLPDDYIAGHVPRLWNEQYLLATALIFGAERFEILFPSWYVGRDAALGAEAARLLRLGPLTDLNLYGASFWLRTV